MRVVFAESVRDATAAATSEPRGGTKPAAALALGDASPVAPSCSQVASKTTAMALVDIIVHGTLTFEYVTQSLAVCTYRTLQTGQPARVSVLQLRKLKKFQVRVLLTLSHWHHLGQLANDAES